ncbi:MAG: lauroyl acyltransferase [Alphaproteobacteria bacterium]|nr:lauroyl acyltransferase [Alphaproteobacteria bacterium]
MSDTIPTAPARQALRPIKRATKFATQVLYVLEYALWLSVMGLFRVLGLERASDLGAWIARTFGPRIPVSRRGRRNMARALPEMSELEREKAILAMWDNLGRTFAEYAHLDKFWAVKPGARIEIVGMENAHKAIAKKSGGLFVSGHCGNWELMPRCIADVGLKGTLVYRPPNNPYVDAWIAKQRRIGLPTLAAKGGDGARGIIRTLKEGAFLAMLVDQKMNDGISVPLFGRPAMTPTGAPQLSLRHGAPIVPAWCERLPGQRFRMTVYPELAMPNTGDRHKDMYELALKLNQFLEARIRENPANWLWLHSRWPKE